jgi:hypothetical protein
MKYSNSKDRFSMHQRVSALGTHLTHRNAISSSQFWRATGKSYPSQPWFHFFRHTFDETSDALSAILEPTQLSPRRRAMGNPPTPGQQHLRRVRLW